MERKWTVYIHTNKTNNKAYIGITSKDAEDRWRNGCGYGKDQAAFYNAIKKYGWDGFEHIIWAEDLTEEEAKKSEKMLIAIFKTNARKWGREAQGYNMTDGGDGACGVKLSEDHKKKISEAKKGKHHTDEARKKMIANNKRKKAVVCIETNIIYESSLEAERQTGIWSTSITTCCKGKQQKAGGLHWKYYEEESNAA